MARMLISKFYGKKWGPAVVWLLRVITGGIFIFSGFVKAIDPWGSIYKFNEYFSVFGFTNLNQFLLFSAFSVAILEFVLGVFVLLGAYRRFAPLLMSAMMLVMLPLTLYLAVTDSVADCGCFGDAVTISNWATFGKNVFITIALVYLLLFNKSVKNIYGFAVQWIVALFSFLFVLSVAIIGYFYQPLLDFRPYPIGVKIVAGNVGNEESSDTEFSFVYEKNGVKKEFAIDSLPDESWSFVDRKPMEDVAADSIPMSQAIAIRGANHESADSVLKSEGEQILILFPSLKNVGISYTYLINEIYDFAQSHDIGVIGLTSSSDSEIKEWNDISMASYNLYHVDDSELKMIARGNPAVVYLKDGYVKWKRTLQSVSAEVVETTDDMVSVSADFDTQKWLYGLVACYLVAMILLLIINRTHLLVKFSIKSSKKNQNKDVNLHLN